MSFKPGKQHQSQCYCSNNCSGCSTIMTSGSNPRKTNTNSISSMRTQPKTNSKQKFVKIRRNSQHAPLGLGHSTTATNGFSRRNSTSTIATTTTSTLATETNTKATRISYPPRQFKCSQLHSPTTTERYEYTPQRDYYERCKSLTTAEDRDRGDLVGMGILTGITKTAAPPLSHDDQLIYALQEFRIQNANDCFSIHRQNDLRMQQQLSMIMLPSEKINSKQKQFWVTVGRPLTDEKAEKEHTKPLTIETSSRKTLTPYAVRQKLLQLRLQSEMIGGLKPSRRLYGALDKSLALRFQETV